MRLLVLSRKDTKHPNAWGAEIVLYQYLQWLVQCWWEVTQIAPSFVGAQKNERIDGVKITRMFSLHTIYFCFRARYLFVNKERYDLVLDHAGGIPLLSPLYIKKTPIVFFTHHVGTTERADYFRQWLKIWWIGELCRRIYNTCILRLYRHRPTITVSQWTAKELRRLGFSAVHIFPNTTEYPRKTRGQKAAVPLILTTVGRIVPNKQFSHAIRLLKKLHVHGYDYRLHIVWSMQDKEEVERLHKLVDELCIKDAVIFEGKMPTDALLALWDRTRYGLVTSDKEWFGMTILEANCRGVPVLAYNIPGVNEVIHHWENGYLVEKNNSDELVDCILEEDDYAGLCSRTESFIAQYPTRQKNIETMHQFLLSLWH